MRNSVSRYIRLLLLRLQHGLNLRLNLLSITSVLTVPPQLPQLGHVDVRVRARRPLLARPPQQRARQAGGAGGGARQHDAGAHQDGRDAQEEVGQADVAGGLEDESRGRPRDGAVVGVVDRGLAHFDEGAGGVGEGEEEDGWNGKRM